MAGVSNVTFEEFIEEKMMKREGDHYPCTILNTDRSNLPCTHWWSILNIYPKKHLFLFNSYGFLGFMAFI